MIFCTPGRNRARGGAEFVVEHGSVTGAFAVGELLTGATSGFEAVIVEVNSGGLTLTCVAHRSTSSSKPTFDDGEVISTSGPGSATVVVTQGFRTPDAMVDITNTDGLVSGDAGDRILSLDMSKTARFEGDAGNPIHIVIDTELSAAGAGVVKPAGDHMWISGFVDGSYDYTDDTTAISAISIEDDTSVSFGASPVVIATISPTAPTTGPKAFGLRNLFLPFDSAHRRYIRITIDLTAAATITIGNVFIGLAVDTDADHGFNYEHGFSWGRVNRGRETERDSGAKGYRPRPALRTFKATLGVDTNIWDQILDDVAGDRPDLIDEQRAPWAFCFDPTNLWRGVTGEHMSSGLFRWRGNPGAIDSGAISGGLNYQPRMKIDLLEHK